MSWQTQNPKIGEWYIVYCENNHSYVAKFTSTGWVFANYKPIKVKVIKFFLYREVSEF